MYNQQQPFWRIKVELRRCRTISLVVIQTSIEQQLVAVRRTVPRTNLCPSKCSTARSKEMSSRIAEMVARDLHPISIVEGDGFKNLLSYIEPGYTVPSHTHISSLCRRLYGTEKKGSWRQSLNVDTYLLPQISGRAMLHDSDCALCERGMAAV